MNKILLIILFNIVIILCYKYNMGIYVYPFIFIMGCILYIKLIYIKDYELIEGFSDEEVLSYWESVDDKIVEESESTEKNLLKNINSVIELLTKREQSSNKYSDKQCEGEFKVNKTDKECGYNVYDEYEYKITTPGSNCEYMPGYKYRDYKPKCEIDSTCKKDSDCLNGKCVKKKCKIDFDCDSQKLDNCDKKGCKNLNKLYGDNKYIFRNNKCEISECTISGYFKCDTKESCEGLGYNYSWEIDNDSGKCVKINESVETCASHECPIGQFHIENNKNIRCKRTYNAEKDISMLDFGNVSKDIEGKEYIDVCTNNVCCQPDWKCSQYYKEGEIDEDCGEYTGNKIIEGDVELDSECYSSSSDNVEYKTFDLSKKKKGTIYYVYNDEYKQGENINKEGTCDGFNCNKCKDENTCTCEYGTPATGEECTVNGSQICSSPCNTGYHLDAASKICKVNICECDNGSGAKGEECTVNRSQICSSSCDPGYHLDDASKICIENLCECDNGSGAKGEECTNRDEKKCSSSCDPGYHPVEDDCIENICECLSGSGATGEECTRNGSQKCASCYPGYNLTDDNTCEVGRRDCFFIHDCSILEHEPIVSSNYSSTGDGGSVYTNGELLIGRGLGWYYEYDQNGGGKMCESQTNQRRLYVSIKSTREEYNSKNNNNCKIDNQLQNSDFVEQVQYNTITLNQVIERARLGATLVLPYITLKSMMNDNHTFGDEYKL